MSSTHHTPHTEDHDPDAFSRRLRARLDDEVTDLPAGGGPEAVLARARSRRRNRRTLLASAAAVAVIAAASSQALTGEPGQAEIAAGAQQAVVDEALGFDWTVTDDGLSYAHEISSGDSGLYALSTAPDTSMEDYPRGDAPRAMYRLGEDGEWTPVGLDGDDPNVATVSERAGALYALSTGPATDSAARPQASVSTDGGETWSSVPLQTATPPSDDVAWTVQYTLDLASNANDTVALVSAKVGVPYEDLFPELFADDGGNHATELTGEGIDLVRYAEDESAEESPDPMRDADSASGAMPPGDDTPSEVVRTVTWADLGVEGPEALAPQRWAYVADGDGWTEVPAPTASASLHGASAELQAIDDAFLLTVVEYSVDGEGTSSAYRSVDGREWAPLNQPGHGQLLAAGDALAHIGYQAGGPVVNVSRDGGTTWNPLDLSSLHPSLEDLSDKAFIEGSSGPLGVALVVGEAEDNGSRVMLFSTDMERWSVTDLAEVAPDGTYLGQVVVGADRVVVLGHTSKGEPRSPERTATLTGIPRRS